MTTLPIVIAWGTRLSGLGGRFLRKKFNSEAFLNKFVSGFKISQWTFFLPSCLGYSKFHFKGPHLKRFKGFVVSTSREQFPSFKVSIDVELPMVFVQDFLSKQFRSRIIVCCIWKYILFQTKKIKIKKREHLGLKKPCRFFSLGIDALCFKQFYSAEISRWMKSSTSTVISWRDAIPKYQTWSEVLAKFLGHHSSTTWLYSPPLQNPNDPSFFCCSNDPLVGTMVWFARTKIHRFFGIYWLGKRKDSSS